MPCRRRHWDEGAGKSSLMDEVMLRIRRDNPNARVALLATDPTRKKTGGALLGDRIRMNSLTDPNLFMRSFASRQSGRRSRTASVGPLKYAGPWASILFL